MSNTVSVKERGVKTCFTTFGVKKGKTYKFKIVQKASTETTNGAYTVRFYNKKASAPGGKSMKKARNLPKNKTKKGNIIAGSSRVKWHKFKITTDKKVTLTIKGNTNKKMKYKFILKKGNKKETYGPYNIPRIGYIYIGNEKSRDYFLKKQFWKGYKGWTCYIKVYRDDKQSSGWYSLKRNK